MSDRNTNKLETATAPLVVIAGPTASGKSALALRVAEEHDGEIVSCDSVAVYRYLDVGSAKPSPADRARVPHHCLDLLEVNESSTAGDYARTARRVLEQIRDRGKLAIVAGGTGLYLRALLDGLAPAPPRDEGLRERLRAHTSKRGTPSLHNLLRRCDPQTAATIHPNDAPKIIRSLEVSILGRKPQSEQWLAGAAPLRGFRVLRIGLNPPRAALYQRINDRAAAMFARGLLEETSAAQARFGEGARALLSLGYAQALAVLQGRQTLPEAILDAQQGHRNYAKRQLTWFRRDPRMRWFTGFGDEPAIEDQVLSLVREHLIAGTSEEVGSR